MSRVETYITIDYKHRQDISFYRDKIYTYIQDKSIKRPLNILMIASPGSGKSHFVDSLAKLLDEYDVGFVSYNMANLKDSEDFITPIETLRNIKVVDKTPIFLIDEFDTTPENYAKLLPLLWDGEVNIGHHLIKVGKVIIILAGSTKVLKEFSEKYTDPNFINKIDDNTDSKTSKIVDLFSRINGGLLTLPSLQSKEPYFNRDLDKIFIAIALLEKRFGKDLKLIPFSLLKFIYKSNFRYGVRSLVLFIES